MAAHLETSASVRMLTGLLLLFAWLAQLTSPFEYSIAGKGLQSSI
jgi:hypothetical protein